MYVCCRRVILTGACTHSHGDLTAVACVCWQCGGPAGADFAAFNFGLGLDTVYFDTRMAFCGRRSKAGEYVSEPVSTRQSR